MAYAFTGSGCAGSTAGTGSLAVSSTVAGGETVFVVVFGGLWRTGLVVSVSDGVNNFQPVGANINAGNNSNPYIQLFKADGVVAGTRNITATDSQSQMVGIAYFRYTGLAAGPELSSVAFNDSAHGTAGANNISFGPMTPPSQPAMLFAAAVGQFATALTTGTLAAFVDRGSVLSSMTARGGDVEDIAISSLSPITPSFGDVDTFSHVTGIAAMFAVAGGRPPMTRGMWIGF